MPPDSSAAKHVSKVSPTCRQTATLEATKMHKATMDLQEIELSTASTLQTRVHLK